MARRLDCPYDDGVQQPSYRARASPDADPYVVVWTGLRRRRLLAIFCFVAWIPVMVAVGPVAERLFGESAAMNIVVSVVTWMLFTSAAFIRMQCPHCGRPLLQKGWYGNAFSRRCMSCGIRIGTPKSAARIDSGRLSDAPVNERSAIVEHVEAAPAEVDEDSARAVSSREAR